MDMDRLQKSRKICQNMRCHLRDTNQVLPRTKLQFHQYVALLGILNLNRPVYTVTTVPWKLNTCPILAAAITPHGSDSMFAVVHNLLAIMYCCVTRGQDHRVLPVLLYRIFSVEWTIICFAMLVKYEFTYGW